MIIDWALLKFRTRKWYNTHVSSLKFHVEKYLDSGKFGGKLLNDVFVAQLKWKEDYKNNFIPIFIA